ncbi:hypothetical protein HAX54_004742, partial [Datura stramonium]|nr:hypothetical protein [Datura stramonium]
KRNERTESIHQLRDEAFESKEEVQEVRAEGPTLAYRTRSVTRPQATTPQSEEGDESSENGSSFDGLGSDSNEESRNVATRSPIRETKPIMGNVIKAKTPGHYKRSFAEEVRLIDSELSAYPDIERGNKFYGLGWMSEASGSYFPNMVHEFYANYGATLDNMCKEG